MLSTENSLLHRNMTLGILKLVSSPSLLHLMSVIQLITFSSVCVCVCKCVVWARWGCFLFNSQYFDDFSLFIIIIIIIIIIFILLLLLLLLFRFSTFSHCHVTEDHLLVQVKLVIHVQKLTSN